MNVFIAWSGSLSLQIAFAVQEFLLNVIPSVRPFVSTKDIWMGSRWNNEIAKQLAESDCGILCLTATNFDAPWLNFEGGALSKLGNSGVIPFLFDLPVSMLSSRPLPQFQSAKYDREDILAMVNSINRQQEHSVRLNPETLQHNFSRCWPRFKAKLDYFRNSRATAVSAEPAQAGVQIVESIKPRLTNSTPASECAGALLEPTVHPRRRGVSSLRPPISKRWDETVTPRIRGVSSLRPPSATRWGAV
jgi:hypothetical protein